MAVFALSPVLGACFAHVAAHQNGWVYISLIMLLYTAALLASLAVVRSCGLRIWWGSRSHPGEEGIVSRS